MVDGRRRAHERDHRRRPAQQLLHCVRAPEGSARNAAHCSGSPPAPPGRPKSGSGSSRSRPPAAGSKTSPAPPRSAVPPARIRAGPHRGEHRDEVVGRRPHGAPPPRRSGSSHISSCRAARSSSVRSDSPGITASDHSKKRGHCDPSTPNSSQMTCRGNGMERSCTTSKAAPLWIGSNSARAFVVTPALHQPHHRRLESRLDQPAVAGVSRRVGVHHRRRRVVRRADLIDQDAPRRAEPARVGADVRHLGMGHDRPEAAARRGPPSTRARLAQLGVELEGIAPEYRLGSSSAGVGCRPSRAAPHLVALRAQTMMPLGRGSPCASSSA